MVSTVIIIGLPQRPMSPARGTSGLKVVSRATATISSVHSGFVLFALFNYLPIYLFNATAQRSNFEISKSHFVKSGFFIP